MMWLRGIGGKHSATVAFCKTIALRNSLADPGPAITLLYLGPTFTRIIFEAFFFLLQGSAECTRYSYSADNEAYRWRVSWHYFHASIMPLSLIILLPPRRENRPRGIHVKPLATAANIPHALRGLRRIRRNPGWIRGRN